MTTSTCPSKTSDISHIQPAPTCRLPERTILYQMPRACVCLSLDRVYARPLPEFSPRPSLDQRPKQHLRKAHHTERATTSTSLSNTTNTIQPSTGRPVPAPQETPTPPTRRHTLPRSEHTSLTDLTSLLSPSRRAGRAAFTSLLSPSRAGRCSAGVSRRIPIHLPTSPACRTVHSDFSARTRRRKGWRRREAPRRYKSVFAKPG